jgi:transformation/transcription domain-associated protein
MMIFILIDCFFPADPVFQKLKGQFTSDFDFSQPDATKMQNLITKLKIWIKILDVKTKQLPK